MNDHLKYVKYVYKNLFVGNGAITNYAAFKRARFSKIFRRITVGYFRVEIRKSASFAIKSVMTFSRSRRFNVIGPVALSKYTHKSNSKNLRSTEYCNIRVIYKLSAKTNPTFFSQPALRK